MLYVEYVYYSVVGLALYALAMLTRLYYRWRTSPLGKFPGPSGSSFLLGETPLFLLEPFFDPHKRWWKELREKGNGESPPFICHDMLLGRHWLWILDPDFVKLILTEPVSQDPVRFPKNYDFIKEIIGEGLVTLDGSAWSRHRRIIQPSFNTKFLRESLDESVLEHTQTLVSAWRKAKNVDIDVNSHMAALTLDVIGDVAFSHKFGASKVLTVWAEHADEQKELEAVSDPLIQALNASLQTTALGLSLSILNYSWLEKYLSRKVRRTRALLNEAVDKVIRKARSKEVNVNGDSKNKNSLLHLLFQATDSESGPGRKSLSDAELRDEIKTFILAGHETTSMWCYWALYALAKFPDVQEKIFHEISKLAPDITSLITLEQVEEMEYLSAFLTEVLRLFSPVAIIFRYTTKEERWQGYTIPANTRLNISPHLLHRHPDHWSNPDDFIPERWLNKGDCASRHRFCFLPFSAGGRNCIGQRFAEIESKLIVANIARAFIVRLAPSMRDQEIAFTLFLTLKSKPPVRIRVQQR